MIQTPGLDGAIKDLGDAIKGIEAAVAPNQTLPQRVADLYSLVPDVIAEIPLIPGIKAEAQGVQPDDYGRLGAELVSALNFTSAHAIAIVQALTKFVLDGAVTDVLELVHAIANKPA